MHFYYISEIIGLQIILYIFLCNTFNGKLSKKIFICPVITTILIILLELSNYDDILFLLSDILFYFVFPVLIIKNISKKRILYLSLTIVGIFSFINISVLFINTFFSQELAITSAFNIFIDIFLLVISIFLSTYHKFTELITYLSSLSKRVKIVSMLFIWNLVILFSILTVCLLQYSNLPPISLTCFLIIIFIVVSFFAFYLLITNNLKIIYYKAINKTIEKKYG